MRHHLWSSRAPRAPLPPPPPSQPITNPNPKPLLPIPTLTFKISRRDLTSISTLTTALIPFLRLSEALAEDSCTTDTITPITKTAFLDVAIDGSPAGRITVGLYSSSAGSARFAALVTGAAGVSYRRKEFVKIAPGYAQHVGVRSYGVDAELARRATGGELTAEALVEEWAAAAEKCKGATRCVAGAVGIVVRDPARPPPKMKLVAKEGRLVVDEEEVGREPNGTEFVIVSKDSPELDDSVLVVGRVVGGMEVVESLAKVKTVQENSSSPYFRVAKLIGDKRAVVAERGFNRPYSKVVVANCGLIE